MDLMKLQNLLNECIMIEQGNYLGGNFSVDLAEVQAELDQAKQLLIPSVVSSALKEGDIIEISGYYFDWEVKEGYSHVLKQTGIYATAQGGLIHSDLKKSLILRINGKKVV